MPARSKKFGNFANMTLTPLVIIAIILAVAAAVALFVPRFPAVLPAFAALLCARFAGAIYVTTSVLIFWAVAAALVLGLRFLQPAALVKAPHGQGYVAAGAVAGALLGYVFSPSAASMIICSALAAFFGAVAYMRTPRSPRLSPASGAFFSYLGAKALPAVVTAVMAAISVMAVL